MKKLFSLLVLIILVGCNKNKPQPAAPTPQPPPATNTTTLTQQEQQLVGIWIMDSVQTYSNNVRTGVIVYTNSLTCRMEFKTESFNGSQEYRSMIDGHNYCNPTPTGWKAPDPGVVSLGGIPHPMILFTATQLGVVNGGGPNEKRYYFHK